MLSLVLFTVKVPVCDWWAAYRALAPQRTGSEENHFVKLLKVKTGMSRPFTLLCKVGKCCREQSIKMAGETEINEATSEYVICLNNLIFREKEERLEMEFILERGSSEKVLRCL